MLTKKLQNGYGFPKNCQSGSLVLIRASLNFYPYFPHLLLNLGEIRLKNLHRVLVNVVSFVEINPEKAALSVSAQMNLHLRV
jgi:hypothetical protein